MKRRGFLGLLVAAPVATPVIVKSFAEPSAPEKIAAKQSTKYIDRSIMVTCMAIRDEFPVVEYLDKDNV
jgi:hypothetical protein